MKISELIQQLEEAKEEHGDIELIRQDDTTYIRKPARVNLSYLGHYTGVLNDYRDYKYSVDGYDVVALEIEVH